jgi:acyl-CoA reductase-like NAD-dependent aldehyde dehydrogenase
VIAVRDPVTGSQIAEVPELSAGDVAALAARARAAQPGWQALGFDGRGEVLRRMQRWVVDNADRIARTIVGETGKAYEDAMLAEVMYGASAVGPAPGATAKTSAGSPHAARPTARSSEVIGVCSLGFRMTALPAASAGIASPNEFVSG